MSSSKAAELRSAGTVEADLDDLAENAVPRLRSLSDREREVLIAIGQGWTNTEIAERLVLTESTVKKHVGRVLAKIGARDRIQAVITAYDAGLVKAKS